MAPRTSRRIQHRGQADDTDGSERNCTRRRDADNIADKQTTQTAARGISTRLRVATVERSQRQDQRTQFVRLGRRTATNERTNDQKTIALRVVNPPTHSCCAMPRFIGAAPPAPVTSWPCHRHGAEIRSTRAIAHEQTRNAKRKAAGEG
jgi:hypothetical protein